MSTENLEDPAAAATVDSSSPTAGPLDAAGPDAVPPDAKEPFTLAAWQVILLVVVLLLIAFRQVGGHGLVFDDLLNIQSNPQLTWEGLGRFWTENFAGMYIPVTYTVWALEAELTRATLGSPQGFLDPAIFHYVNLALHIAATLLVYVWLNRLVGSTIGACAGALLFALHPLQVETVNYITETKGTLAAVFGVSALILFDGYARGVPPRRWFELAAATLLLLLAVLSKPIAASTPLIAAAVTFGLQRATIRQAAPGLAAWFALAAAVMLWTSDAQAVQAMRNQAPLIWRPLIAADALSFYLSKLVWPVGLSLDYGRSPAWLIRQPAVYITWLLPAIVLGVLCALPYARIWVTAFAVFVAGLAPTLGLASFVFQEYSTVADRYAYLALLGPALALAWALARWPRLEVYGAAAAGILACTVFSNGLSRFWQSQAMIFSRAREMNPGSVLANLAIGHILTYQHNYKDAVAAFEAALETDPEHPGVLGNLGCTLQAAGDTERAAEVLYKARDLKPNNYIVYVGLGRLYARQRDTAAAIEQFQLALKYQPLCYEAHCMLAQQLAEQGQTAEAVAHFREGLRIRPGSLGPTLELAWLLATTSDDQVRDGEAALRLAEEAQQLTAAQSGAEQAGRNLWLREIQAAALAEVKRFTESQRLLEGLVVDVGQLAAAAPDVWRPFYERVQSQLARVREGQPLREPPAHRLGIPEPRPAAE